MRLEICAVAALVVALSGCSATATKNPRIVASPTPSNANEIVIYEYKFVPFMVTVAAGTLVTWINHDIAPHTATRRSFDDESFDSGTMGATQIFSHRFRKAGTYDYLCVFHQGMRGTIVVQ